MEKKYDVAVALRTYTGLGKNPPLFKEKIKLMEFCLKSFKNSLGSLHIKLWAILDRCPVEFKTIFMKYFPEEDLVFVELTEGGNQRTFAEQIKILSEQTDSEFIYFAEDDYFYLPNQFEKLVTFMRKNPDAHFVSVYEHSDYYTQEIHDYPAEIRICENLHWRTGVGTTWSFLTTKSTFIKTRKTFETFVNTRNHDISIWMALTKYNVCNPWRILKFLFRKYPDKNMNFIKMIGRAWQRSWKQIMFGSTWKLWTPIPSIATHMEANYLAIGVDWENEFKKGM